jgi:hypothetical protein
VGNPDSLPERLKQRFSEPLFKSLVQWIEIEISLFGGHRRFGKVALKYQDELLAAALLSETIHCAEMAAFFKGEGLVNIAERVLGSKDPLAMKALARVRPEMAQDIQNILVTRSRADKARGENDPPWDARGVLDASFFESFLREVPDTNPVPVQHWYVDSPNDNGEGLICMTMRLPNRTSLFATVALLLTKSRNNVSRHLARLCLARPEAVEIVQKCLLELECAKGHIQTTTFVAVCVDVPGIDLDLIEEFILANWDKSGQRLFCSCVKRDRGPARDMLAVEHVMES